jgi:hypothetical protein
MIPGRHVPAPSVALRKRVGFVGYVEPTLGEEPPTSRKLSVKQVEPYSVLDDNRGKARTAV